MKIITIALIILAASIANAQSIVMTPGAGGQLYPAYVDPQYGIDGRQLVPQDKPQPFVIYNSIVPEGRSQEIYRVEPYGRDTWLVTPQIVDND